MAPSVMVWYRATLEHDEDNLNDQLKKIVPESIVSSSCGLNVFTVTLASYEEWLDVNFTPEGREKVSQLHTNTYKYLTHGPLSYGEEEMIDEFIKCVREFSHLDIAKNIDHDGTIDW